MHRLFAIALVAAGLFFSPAASTPARAQEGVFAIVNGLPITTFDIPQRQRLLQVRDRRAVSRQDAIEDLINDRVKFAEARRFRVAATDPQVEAAFAQVAGRSGYPPAAFEQVLRAQGIDPRVYRGKLRADLSWSNMVQARYGRTIFVTDSQLASALQRRTGGGPQVEYLLRPITIVVAPNAAPAVVQRRAAQAASLRTRFQNCATDFALVAQIEDAAVREPLRRNGSDLSADLRRILDQTGVGKLTPANRNAQGFELIAVCGRTELRAEDQTTRNQARDEATNAEMQRIAQGYLQRLRRTAVIEYKAGRQ